MNELNVMKEKKNYDFTTKHDFISERLLMKILGGFTIIKKPFYAFIMNCIFVFLFFCLNLYLFIMGIVTVVLEPSDKEVVSRSLQNVGLLFFAMVMPAVKYYSKNGLNDAVRMIRMGIFNYNEQNEFVLDIKRNRVGQFRRLDNFLVTLFFCTFFIANAVFIPIMKIIFIAPNGSKDLVNPYLPLPIYMPFDTYSPFGFSVAYATNALYFFFFYLSSFCSVHTYVSCAVQLIAELEILTESITNIDQRARTVFTKGNLINPALEDALYDSSAFQDCLYNCLRQNILHHHAIIRFMAAIKDYMVAFNFVCAFLFSIVMAASIMYIIESPEINIGVIASFCSQLIGYLIVNGIGQMITDKSSQILNALYSTPWMFYGRRFNATLRIMSINSQRPMTLKIIGTVVSLENFADMISAGYKILNFFR